eukprot:GHVL01042499.1.p1 GENE.GHVL01042499.1~~GHVL01042499.1.p1  ORF type:complete len:836 (-),score=151.94 GHVL01042499.1:1917-4424(-)
MEFPVSLEVAPCALDEHYGNPNELIDKFFRAGSLLPDLLSAAWQLIPLIRTCQSTSDNVLHNLSKNGPFPIYSSNDCLARIYITFLMINESLLDNTKVSQKKGQKRTLNIGLNHSKLIKLIISLRYHITSLVKVQPIPTTRTWQTICDFAVRSVLRLAKELSWPSQWWMKNCEYLEALGDVVYWGIEEYPRIVGDCFENAKSTLLLTKVIINAKQLKNMKVFVKAVFLLCRSSQDKQCLSEVLPPLFDPRGEVICSILITENDNSNKTGFTLIRDGMKHGPGRRSLVDIIFQLTSDNSKDSQDLLCAMLQDRDALTRARCLQNMNIDFESNRKSILYIDLLKSKLLDSSKKIRQIAAKRSFTWLTTWLTTKSSNPRINSAFGDIINEVFNMVILKPQELTTITLVKDELQKLSSIDSKLSISISLETVMKLANIPETVEIAKIFVNILTTKLSYKSSFDDPLGSLGAFWTLICGRLLENSSTSEPFWPLLHIDGLNETTKNANLFCDHRINIQSVEGLIPWGLQLAKLMSLSHGNVQQMMNLLKNCETYVPVSFTQNIFYISPTKEFFFPAVRLCLMTTLLFINSSDTVNSSDCMNSLSADSILANFKKYLISESDIIYIFLNFYEKITKNSYKEVKVFLEGICLFVGSANNHELLDARAKATYCIIRLLPHLLGEDSMARVCLRALFVVDYEPRKTLLSFLKRLANQLDKARDLYAFLFLTGEACFLFGIETMKYYQSQQEVFIKEANETMDNTEIEDQQLALQNQMDSVNRLSRKIMEWSSVSSPMVPLVEAIEDLILTSVLSNNSNKKIGVCALLCLVRRLQKNGCPSCVIS